MRLIQKLFCLVLVLVFMLSITVSANEIKTSYNYKESFSAETGLQNNGTWSYCMNTDASFGEDGEYTDYKSYTTMVADGTSTWYGTAGASNSGTITKDKIKIKVNGRVAFVWTAPMSGKVTITPGSVLGREHNTFKTHSDTGAEYNLQPIDVRLVQFSNDKANTLFAASLEPKSEHCYTESAFASSEDIVIDVVAGEKLFFEVYGTSSNYSEIRWNPQIRYTNCVQFYNQTSDVVISDCNNVSAGDTVVCTLYNEETSSGSYRLWFLLKDASGSLISASISDVVNFDSGNNTAICEIIIPEYDEEMDESGYKSWSFCSVLTKGTSYYPYKQYDIK